MHFKKWKFALFCFICLDVTTSLSSNHHQRLLTENQIESTSENENEDCHISKLENLNFDELLSKAQVNDFCRDQANIVFKQTYGHVQAKISAFEMANDSILFIAPDKVDDVLRVFGSSIERLALNYMNGIDYKKVEKLTNDHCSETLIELEVVTSQKGTFSEMKNPFKTVESLIFHGTSAVTHEGALDLDKLFPALSYLQLNGYADAAAFDRSFPNLTEFDSSMILSFNFSSFFGKNSQIKRLNSWNEQLAYVKAVHDLLPTLEEFTLNVPQDFQYYQGETLNFQRLKAVRIVDYGKSFNFNKILFGNLNSLELEFKGKMGSDWIEFIAKNENLQELSTLHAILNEEGFLKLAKELPCLTTASLVCSAEIDLDAVVEFVKGHDQIKTFTLTLVGSNGNNTMLVLLSNELDEWNIRLHPERFNCIEMTKANATEIVEEATHEEGEETDGNNACRLISINLSMIIFAEIVIMMYRNGLFNGFLSG